jgi:integrase
MGRHQQGYLYKAFGGWHVRYWTTELKDGKPVRVQRSHKLCDADLKGTKTYAKTLRDEYMTRINALSGVVQEHDLSVKEFWETKYLPYCEKHKRVSTLIGYKQLWKQHLEPHFVGLGLTLREYDTPQATNFLTSLAERGLGRRSVAHVRSLASGIFRHAKQLGIIKQNPWREAGSHVEPKAPPDTPHYSLEEAEAISNALLETGHDQEQLIFCLACFCGLRPGEIAGLKWEDIAENDELSIGGEKWLGWLHVRRAVVCGEVGETKTPESVASVPLVPSVRGMFSAWRIKSGNPATGWVFQNRVGDPINLEVIARRVLIPTLKAKGLEWKGLYAGRRASGTLLTQLTGNALAAQFVLRHKNLGTTEAFYIKPSKEAAITGMGLLADKLAERKALTSSNGNRHNGENRAMANGIPEDTRAAMKLWFQKRLSEGATQDEIIREMQTLAE